ncbi:MAG: hypothetical protein PUP93_16015 [Rhizonema sp. NSF051]|nr:hypothetical protein [Rhizonema sp. NSF051]
MSTIKTATLKSNKSSEELDDASLQAITGGLAIAGGFLGVGENLAALPYLPLLGAVIPINNSTSVLTGLPNIAF